MKKRQTEKKEVKEEDDDEERKTKLEKEEKLPFFPYHCSPFLPYLLRFSLSPPSVSCVPLLPFFPLSFQLCLFS